MNTLTTALSILVATATAVSGLLIAAPAHAAAEPKSSCYPTSASITTSSSRIVGTGNAKCDLSNVPEHSDVRIFHYYGLLPDVLAFWNRTKKPATALTWSGTTKRCDNSTTAEYYTQIELVQYAGPMVNSARKRITACAGTGS